MRGELSIRPLGGRDELDLFRSIPYVINEELEGDLDGGRRRLDWLWVALRADRLVGRAGWWARSADDPPQALDILDVSDADDGVRLVDTAMRAVLPAGSTPPDYIRFLPPTGHRARRSCAMSTSGGPCSNASAPAHSSNAFGCNGTRAARCRNPPGGCGSEPLSTAGS